MPRKQAMLKPFFLNALAGPKYRNLNYVDRKKMVFSLYLPHKTNRLEMEDQYIFKDWYAKTKRSYRFPEDYTIARQAITAALRKSDYIELMNFEGNKLICRILEEEEVKEKKQQKKDLKLLKGKKKEDDTLDESGYESGLNSPENCMDYEQNMSHIVHDHDYVFSPLARESEVCSGVLEVSNEPIIIDRETGALKQDNSGIKSDLQDTCLKEDFSNIPVLPDDVTLDVLDKIPNEHLIRSNCGNLELALQVYDSIGSEANTKENLYVFEDLILLNENALLICKLFQEMGAKISDTSSIRIVLDETVQRRIQGFSCVKKWENVGDHYLMVFLSHNG